MKIGRFEEIEGWQLARKLSIRVYSTTCEGTFARDFSLRGQINRATGSAMDNVAEGFDGGSDGEFVRFLAYAQRSCTEVQSQLYRALDRGHIDRAAFDELYELANHTTAQDRRTNPIFEE
jgi:four helix bundle protein